MSKEVMSGRRDRQFMRRLSKELSKTKRTQRQSIVLASQSSQIKAKSKDKARRRYTSMRVLEKWPWRVLTNFPSKQVGSLRVWTGDKLAS